MPNDPNSTTDQASRHDSCVSMDAVTLERLQALADAWRVSVPEAICRLIEVGAQGMLSHQAREQHALTKKQTAVLECLKSGLSVKEIAGKLGISEGTVRTHIRRMRSSLNRSDLLSLRFYQEKGNG